ncbi:hypothetical protein ATG_18300 [Desulfurococcaceae archaeon AG1]|nr:hypothetical protein ATG_18300 [Desulfurococcaceae archaeon AG1]
MEQIYYLPINTNTHVSLGSIFKSNVYSYKRVCLINTENQGWMVSYDSPARGQEPQDIFLHTKRIC